MNTKNLLAIGALLCTPAVSYGCEGCEFYEPSAPEIEAVRNTPTSPDLNSDAIITLTGEARETTLKIVLNDNPEPGLKAAAAYGLFQFYSDMARWAEVAKRKAALENTTDAEAKAQAAGDLGKMHEMLAEDCEDRERSIELLTDAEQYFLQAKELYSALEQTEDRQDRVRMIEWDLEDIKCELDCLEDLYAAKDGDVCDFDCGPCPDEFDGCGCEPCTDCDACS